MQRYLRRLVVSGPVILLMSAVLDAQHKADVTIGVMVMQVDSERAGHLIATMASAGTARLLSALIADNKTKLMNVPQLRASDGQEKSLSIGGGPYRGAVGGFQPRGTVGVSPLPSNQFNNTAAGVNVMVTPHVHSNEEVTLHVEVGVYNDASTASLKGISQPIINLADISMHEGEVNILGWLRQPSATKSLAGLPGMTNIPALGETMIALIPHLCARRT